MTTLKMSTSQRFDGLLDGIKLTSLQREDAKTKYEGVTQCLNQHYYGVSSKILNSLLVGSWGKSTQVRPPRDIDILFELPKSVYDRFEGRTGNKQSALLQEVKSVLAAKYSTTKMRADGQVIVVPFASYAVEVLPAIKLNSGQYWICNTNNGGSYKAADPKAEQKAVTDSNSVTSGNTRDLIRMAKCWQEHCNVPLKSFQIELLAMEFLKGWQYAGKSSVYYDWMVRDFFEYLKNLSFKFLSVAGTGEWIIVSNTEWKTKAESAHARALKAIEYDNNDTPCAAGGEWQKIFGTTIPIC